MAAKCEETEAFCEKRPKRNLAVHLCAVYPFNKKKKSAKIKLVKNTRRYQRQPPKTGSSGETIDGIAHYSLKITKKLQKNACIISRIIYNIEE